MKRRLSTLLLALTLLTALCVPAGASLVESGTYWIETHGASDVNALIERGQTEPILILYYSRHCGYSQNWIPQFKDYAEQAGITVYGMDEYVDGPDQGVMNFGIDVYGEYPIAIRFWGNGAPPVVTDSIRSLEAFEEQLYAEPPKTDDSGFQISADGTLLRYTGSAADVTVPAGVTAIAAKAFAENDNLRSVTVPEGVTSIGEWAFQFCENLVSVTLPDSVTQMGYGCFDLCTSLREVRLPGRLTVLPYGTFASCWSLTHIQLPDSLTEIGMLAFHNCYALREITIPAGVTSIGENAVGSCWALHTVRFLGAKPQMPTGEQSPFSGSSGAGIWPAGDTSWGTAEQLLQEHPDLNWGGRPGEVLQEPSDFFPWNDGSISDWAFDEVWDTHCYELFPLQTGRDYDQPVSRKTFCGFVIQVISKHTGLDSSDILQGDKTSPFTDTDSLWVIAANRLGLVSGRGDGTFDPEGSITRQEAAAMLARTARYLGMEGTGTSRTFSDQTDIAPWAADSVSFVTTLSTPDGRTVMGSTGTGFSPLATYTLQEACCSFLRLYQSLVGI